MIFNMLYSNMTVTLYLLDVQGVPFLRTLTEAINSITKNCIEKADFANVEKHESSKFQISILKVLCESSKHKTYSI